MKNQLVEYNGQVEPTTTTPNSAPAQSSSSSQINSDTQDTTISYSSYDPNTGITTNYNKEGQVVSYSANINY